MHQVPTFLWEKKRNLANFHRTFSVMSGEPRCCQAYLVSTPPAHPGLGPKMEGPIKMAEWGTSWTIGFWGFPPSIFGPILSTWEYLFPNLCPVGSWGAKDPGSTKHGKPRHAFHRGKYFRSPPGATGFLISGSRERQSMSKPCICWTKLSTEPWTKYPGELIAIGDYTTWLTGGWGLTHRNGNPFSTNEDFMRWDPGIFNGSTVTTHF